MLNYNLLDYLKYLISLLSNLTYGLGRFRIQKYYPIIISPANLLTYRAIGQITTSKKFGVQLDRLGGGGGGGLRPRLYFSQFLTGKILKIVDLGMKEYNQ